jgi:hypothetical protein
MDKQNSGHEDLQRECTLFCCYLARQKPTNYIIAKYADGHRFNGLSDLQTLEKIDRFLLSIARASTFTTGIADAYARLFYNEAALRKKLVLLLAILESCAPTHYFFDIADRAGKMRFYLSLIRNGMLFVLNLFISLVIIAPFHFLSMINAKSPGQNRGS